LNFNLENLKEAHKKTPLSAVVLQNMLGYEMSELSEIVAWVRKEKILLIEDMAHNFGATYSTGEKAGTLGDMAMMSFSRDKGLDVVSGGALIYKRGVLGEMKIEISNVGKSQNKKDRKYAIRTWWVRKTTPFYFGKVLHKFWRKSGKLLSPMQYGNDEKINEMPAWMASEALKIWQTKWYKILSHRQKNAKFYSENLNKKLLIGGVADFEKSAALRFPILLKNEKMRTDLIKYLARHSLMLSDIFFDTTVAPKNLQHLSIYQKGSCPNAEDVANRLFNLPTHINVNRCHAEKIAQLVNKFVEGQK
jgi:dTDP-4-amino-4,6-dideoxygalactose transaminase